MENKNKVLLTVIGVATLLVAVIGATFAYFSATAETDAVEVTTGAATISISASNNSVTNIKPTTFTYATADSNADVVKMTLEVTGSSDVAGSYDIVMNEPAIAIGTEEDQGSVSDIMYAVYADGSNTAIKTGSFTGTVTETTIVENVAFDGSGEIADTYYVYVYVNNNDAEQNNLQNVNFKLSFAANASTAA